MDFVVIYLIVLVVTYIPMYFVSYFIPLKKNTLGAQSAFRYIVKRYDLSMDKKRVKSLSKIVAFANAILVSIPIMIVLFGDLKRIWVFMIAFVIFVIGMLVLYNLIGFILKKKGW